MKTESYIFEETAPGQFDADSAFPENPDPGKFYFCPAYSCSVHLCPCGCGEKVFLPIKPDHEQGAFWGLKGNTLTPSVQKRLGCLSHYQIINGKVIW